MAAALGSNPTRQQLDELDALLQRMLALPLHPLEQPLAPPAPPPVVPRVAAMPAAVAAPPAPVVPRLTPPVAPPPAYVPPPLAPQLAGLKPPAHAAPLPTYTAPEAEEPPPRIAARPVEFDLNPKVGSSVLGRRSPMAAPPPDIDEDDLPSPVLEFTSPAPFAGYRVPDTAWGAPPPIQPVLLEIPPPAPPPPQFAPPPAEPRYAASPRWEEEPVAVVPPAAAKLRVEEVQAPVAPEKPVAPRPPAAAGPARERLPVLLWPLAATDAVLSFGLRLAGGPGEWMASPGGKTVLGPLGMLLLVGSTVCGVLDWYGYRWAW